MRLHFLKKYKNELMALTTFLVGCPLCLLAFIQKVPLLAGIAGVAMLMTGMLVFCMRLSSERLYKEYYKTNYEVEHESIEEEARKSIAAQRYQGAVLSRYESACRDLGISDEQRDYLLMLLMEEKKKVEEELKSQDGGYL